MMRLRDGVAAVLVVMVGFSLVSSAQEQSRGTRRREYGGSRGSFLRLLRVEEVRKELKLTGDQTAKVTAIGEKLRGEMREQFTALREIEDAQARRTRMTELRKDFDGKARVQIKEAISREQMSRLYQIRLQVRGVIFGLNHSYIAGKLKLTDEQKAKAAELEKATQTKTYEAYGSLRNLSSEERREKYAEMRKTVGDIRSKAEADALALLTAEQKDQITKMKGEPFEMPSRR